MVYNYLRTAKYFLFTAAILFLSLGATAQSEAYASIGYAPYMPLGVAPADSAVNYHKHSLATKIGGDVMLVGLGVGVIGIIGVVSPFAADNDHGHGEGYKEATEVVFAGSATFIIGVFIRVVGHETDKKNNKRFTVTTFKNQVGFAYNF